MASKRGQKRRAEAKKLWEQQRGCQNKIVYKTQDDAKAAQRAAWGHGMHVVEYRCHFGNHWHLGHPSARRWQSIRDKKRGRG